jgi:signal peptidase II
MQVDTLFRGPHSRIGGMVAAATFIVDQASKYWLINVFDIVNRKHVTVTPFLDLVYQLNPGVSYSFFEMPSALGQMLLSLFALAVSVGIVLWLAKAQHRLTAIALGLILGGALDRPLLGGVADFFALHAFGYSWYVFNLADVAIVAGVIGLLYDSLIANRAKPVHES